MKPSEQPLAATPAPREDIKERFQTANEHRDYSIYTRLMDAALEAKAQSLFRHFGDVKEDDVIVDAGSGTGKLTEYAAREFHGARVYALDISHELLEQADENRALIKLVYGNAAEQNFPDDSVDVKYYSTVGHEIESFGGAGSMTEAVRNTFKELKPGGRIVIRDFAKPSRSEPVLMRITSSVGMPTIDPETPSDAIDYNALSTEALFDRFHREFGGGKAFDYERIEKNGIEYLQLRPEWAHEFYLHKDYTGNWRQEIKEKYTYWSLEEAERILAEAGYVNVRVIPDPNEYILKNRLEGKIGLYDKADDDLHELSFPATHMVIVGEKPPSQEDTENDRSLPEIDYEALKGTIGWNADNNTVRIGNETFAVEPSPISGMKKRLFELPDDPAAVLKVARTDVPNAHTVFRSLYQMVERQHILDELEVPHTAIRSWDPEGPPYRYVIQERVPKEAPSAADLITRHELTETDIEQIAAIVNRYESGKEWQLDLNPFSWHRVTLSDGTTQMTYVSGKVYRYDERWEFRKVGLPQWTDERFINKSAVFTAEIPTAKEYGKVEAAWKDDSRFDIWRRYLKPELQPGA